MPVGSGAAGALERERSPTAAPAAERAVAVRSGRGDLFASKAPRHPGRIGPVVRDQGNGSRKSKRKAKKKPGFEYGLASKEPVVSRGAPKLSVKQRREVVAQLERTGQGCSISRVGTPPHYPRLPVTRVPDGLPAVVRSHVLLFDACVGLRNRRCRCWERHHATAILSRAGRRSAADRSGVPPQY
jgi:hypothetical protein